MPADPDVVVRDARSDEDAIIRELTLAAYAQYSSRMAPRAWSVLREAITAALATGCDAQRIVVQKAGSILGSVLLFPPSTDPYGGIGPRMHWPEIRLLAVTPESRGLGVGKLLVNECILRARAMGAEAIGLHTSNSMWEAIRLYESLGFERDPSLDIWIEGAENIDAYCLSLSR